MKPVSLSKKFSLAIGPYGSNIVSGRGENGETPMWTIPCQVTGVTTIPKGSTSKWMEAPRIPCGSRDSLLFMATWSWVRPGTRLTTWSEHEGNSYYGATGSPYFRYYDKRLAQATTLTGQCLIKKTAKNTSGFVGKLIGDDSLDVVLAGDTDSICIDMYPIFKKFVLDKERTLSTNQKTDFYNEVCVSIEKKAIAPTLDSLVTTMNARENCLSMKREVICSGAEKTGFAGFWVAKKRYALLVNDSEGFRYENPKMKIMGLAQVQSSTPKICREQLSKATRMMIEEGPEAVRKYFKQVHEEFVQRPVEEIALPRSVSDVEKYTENGRPIKGAPVQSKAAINHNWLIHKLGLEKSIQPIRDGDKLKFLYLDHNKYGFDVIGFKDQLPKEFELEKYVAVETHFEKAFKKPLSDMMEACGWEIEERASLENFF